MKAQATELQAAESDLKQLMADVTRAVEKVQEAVAKIAPKAVPAKVETALPRLTDSDFRLARRFHKT